MRKIFFVVSITALLLLISNSVFASAPAPSPKCYVKGTIQSVEFKEAYNESCLVEGFGCPTDMELYHPARYFLKIRIEEVSYVSGEIEFITCENMLPLNTEHTIFINKDKVKTGDVFRTDQKINGQVSSFWGESFDIYTLEDDITECAINSDCGEIKKCGMTWQCIDGVCRQLSVECPLNDCTVDSDCYPEGFVLGKCGTFYTCSGGRCYEGSAACPLSTEQAKITPKQALSNATEITAVHKIELKEESKGLVYVINGQKPAKILFIIPVSMGVQTKVNAETGEIISVNTPWWSFLAW